MSKKVNSLFVGAFIVSAIFLFVSLLVFFSSSSLFTPAVKFYVFFDGSLSGLDVGSAVKFKGVRIGSVETIDITYDNDVDKACASVLLKIDASSLKIAKKRQFSSKDYRDFYSEQISRGLAAKLSLESIVTGKNFIAIDYYPKDDERFFKDIDGLKYQQMPSMRTVLDEFIGNVDTVVKNIAQIDFSGIGWNVNSFLIKLCEAFEGLNLSRISAAFSESCESLNKVLCDGKVENTLNEIGEVVSKFNLKFDGILDGVSESFGGIRDVFSSDSSFRQRIEETLVQFESALRSLREFLDFLERNPNAIFAGKQL
ncbi:MAG: MlaD family protein [Puniceicoccales bacterium]|nr:MlaD family protein [Puniceicoccales bacterium]